MRRPILAWVLFLLIVLLGGTTAMRLGLSRDPDFPSRDITIVASYPGMQPQNLEQQVVQTIEDTTASVEGVEHITSISNVDWCMVQLRISDKRHIDSVVQDISQKLASQRFPKGMDPPTVRKQYVGDSPIAFLGLEAPHADRVTAAAISRRVKDALQAIDGVSEVSVHGVAEPEVHLWVDPEALWAHHVTAADVAQSVREHHARFGSGALVAEAGRILLNADAEAADLEALCELPLTTPQEGTPPVRLCDVAAVQVAAPADLPRLRWNGENAVLIRVVKQRAANAVSTVARLHAKVAEINATLPAGQKLTMLLDLSEEIKHEVHGLMFELILALIATGCVCRLFLGTWQSTLNVMLAVPVSLLGACAALYVCGFTLNVYSMMGLTLAVGIVVDDAIMVQESIHCERARGLSAAEAALRGTSRIRFAALAATLGVVCIFAPVLLMGGVASRAFLELGVAVSVAVLLSYVEAVTLAPARTATQSLAKVHQHPRWEGFEAQFARWLGHCAERPKLTLAIAAALCCIGLSLAMRVDRASPVDTGSCLVTLAVHAPVNHTLEQTDIAVRQLDAKVRATPGVAGTFCVTGSENPYEALVFANIDAKHTRDKRIEADLWGLVAQTPPLQAAGFGASDIQVSIVGPDRVAVTREAHRLRERMNHSELFAGTTTSARQGMPQLDVRPMRERLRDARITPAEFARTVHDLFAGEKLGKFELSGRRTDISMKLLASARQDPQHLAEIPLRDHRGQLVPLGTMATFEPVRTEATLRRYDRQANVDVSGALRPGVKHETAQAMVERWATTLPADIQLQRQGAWLAHQESQSSLAWALLGGLVCAYLVLAAQFNSFRLPLVVICTVPLAASGAAFAMWALGLPLGNTGMIGLLLLFGLAKKNAILLVDCAMALERGGTSPARAALMAAKSRLRPIIMTTCATMIAVVPAALALGPTGASRQAMAVVVLGGMLSATLLTLVAVPIMLGMRRCRAQLVPYELGSVP